MTLETVRVSSELSSIVMTHYILDSSVVVHGDLWNKKPARLVRYRPDLQFSPFPLDQWPDREELVKMAVLALKWAEQVSSDSIKLWITPTVKSELSCAPQVCSVGAYRLLPSIVECSLSTLLLFCFLCRTDNTSGRTITPWA